jgi:acetaldehyde dehydrogenase/alcohol dehydrogenase
MSKADLILATGGAPMVKAAYSSGKPAIGVGAGNTPVVIDETADLRMAVNSIVLSKTFDLGLSCSSEQSVIVLSKVYAAVKKEFEERGAYFLKGDELDKVRKTIFTDHVLNNDIVGQPAIKIAALSDITVPVATKVLIGEVESVELDEPFSREKLSPLLAMYQAKNFEEAMQKAGRLLELSGRGHTSVLYTDPSLSADRIEKFNTTIKTCRILINTPSSQGASGGFFNSKLVPSLMLGCGSWGGNSVCENIGVKHLLNIKSIASRRENMMWFRVPPKIYFKYGCLPVALRDLKKSGKKKAFIVTDKVLYELGFADNVLRVLEELHIDYKVIFDVEPEPSYTTVRRGAEEVTGFQPDAIIALGGGSVIDAAKMMRALYEHPQIQLEKIALPFMEINKKILSLPETGKKAILIAIPTTAGTGSEITAFAAITDEKTGLKNPLADFGFIPDIAIIDAALTMKMPKALTAASGMDALVHALESFVSVFASEYTNGLALEAIRLIFKYLPEAYHGGNTNIEAREKMSYAAAIAGMAFGNTSLGICHSMAHQLGGVHHVTHGVANALLIAEVIRFNGVEMPEKQAAFPQYKYHLDTKERYARIAAYLNLGGTTDSEKTVLLIAAIEDLKTQVGMPTSIKDAGVSETQFYATLDAMSEHAFEDQCTGTNPRFPLIRELKQLYINSFERQQRVKPELESTLAKESLAER